MLVPGDLGAVRGVHDLVELAGQRRNAGAHRLERLGAARARRLGCGAPLRPPGRATASAAATATARPGGDRAGDRRLRGPLTCAGPRPAPWRPARPRPSAASESARPLIARSRSSTVRTSSRASISAVAGGRGPLRQFLALLVGLQVLELGVARALPVVPRPPPRRARSSARRAWPASFSALARGAYRGVQPLGLVRRGPRGAAEPAEPAGDLRRGRVRRPHPAAGLLKLLPGRLLRLGRLGECLRGGLSGQLRGGQPRGRLVGGGAHVQQ